ncbi:MAG TPA: hypothetical protein VEJ44_05555 [Acidimicrobiales bacterium]|nr:hypothetical protein [Acidimicrobiales bacterium]
MQPFDPGVEIVIDSAVMAPVELAVPRAVAHFPTARSAEVADCVSA